MLTSTVQSPPRESYLIWNVKRSNFITRRPRIESHYVFRWILLLISISVYFTPNGMEAGSLGRVDRPLIWATS